MNNSTVFAALFLALPLAALAQTKPAPTAPAKTTTTQTTTPAPATQQVTEVTEELDPATGKVIKRTTRTTTVPLGTPLPGARPAAYPDADVSMTDAQATDSQVSDFYREKTKVAALTAPALVDAYSRFIDKVRNDRRTWTSADWNRAAAVLSSLNGRYDQLRSSFSLDDKFTIRGAQGEFQALRTARQLSKEVSDKL